MTRTLPRLTPHPRSHQSYLLGEDENPGDQEPWEVTLSPLSSRRTLPGGQDPAPFKASRGRTVTATLPDSDAAPGPGLTLQPSGLQDACAAEPGTGLQPHRSRPGDSVAREESTTASFGPTRSPAQQPSVDSLHDPSGGPVPINLSAAEEAKSSGPWTTGGKTHPCQGSLLPNSPQRKTTPTPTRRQMGNKTWCFYTTAHRLATRTNS